MPVLRRLVVRMFPTMEVLRVSIWRLVRRKREQMRRTALLAGCP
jgi:hypothetical protein